MRTCFAGSQIAMSASLPTAMVPLRGYSPYSFAAWVALSEANVYRSIRP